MKSLYKRIYWVFIIPFIHRNVYWTVKNMMKKIFWVAPAAHWRRPPLPPGPLVGFQSLDIVD